MIGASNIQGQKYWVGIVQWAPETSFSEEIVDIFRNYNIDNGCEWQTEGGKLTPVHDKYLKLAINTNLAYL